MKTASYTNQTEKWQVVANCNHVVADYHNKDQAVDFFEEQQTEWERLEIEPTYTCFHVVAPGETVEFDYDDQSVARIEAIHPDLLVTD